MAEGDCAGPGRRNWVPLLWLVYLLWLPLEPILAHAPAWQWAAMGGATVVFLILYLISLFKLPPMHPARVPILLAVYAIGTWVMTFNVGGSSFFVFSAGMIGFSLSSRRAWPFLLVFCLSIPLIDGWLLHDVIWGWSMAFIFAGIVGVTNIRNAEDGRANAKLRRAHDEIERLAKVTERERIARDLHDVLGHTLSLIVLKSELASKLADVDPQRAAREIRDVETIARGALHEVREAVSGFRSAGIAAEIENARAVLETAGVTVDAQTDAVTLPPTHEGVLALAIREAVTNVIRHAQAHVVELRLIQSNGTCRFTIADDGRGSSDLVEGNGLGGMRARIEALGGTMLRDTAAGTRLTLTLPTEGRAV